MSSNRATAASLASTASMAGGAAAALVLATRRAGQGTSSLGGARTSSSSVFLAPPSPSRSFAGLTARLHVDDMERRTGRTLGAGSPPTGGRMRHSRAGNAA